MLRLLAEIESQLDCDVNTNKAMGRHGADHIMKHYEGKPVKMLTHCNTGSLATAGFGTALGIIWKENSIIIHGINPYLKFCWEQIINKCWGICLMFS